MSSYVSAEGEMDWEVPNANKPCKTWYRIVGTLDTALSPVVALHGGPGSGHNYMVALTDIHEARGAPIVLYDQIGCGRSTHLPEKLRDKAFWTVDLFIKELDKLIDHLNLRDKGFHLLGQSWGGMLAGSYASMRPRGLKRLILSGSPASMPLYREACQQRLAQLPPDVRRTLEDCDKKGDHESPEYKEASTVFMKKFVCRLDPVPEPIQQAWANLKENPAAYMTMQGPSEFATVGTLKDWEGWKEAQKIQAETLLLNGKYDEVMDFVIEPWFRAIDKVRWVTLEESSHTSMWEERERFMQLCSKFLYP
ncbi:proline-specific peptidase [Hypoxylon cercidicola]|nr:proline-specific peptidase [Hypoxylon cercidicola]